MEEIGSGGNRKYINNEQIEVGSWMKVDNNR